MVDEISKKKILIIGATGFLGEKCYSLFKKEFPGRFFIFVES